MMEVQTEAMVIFNSAGDILGFTRQTPEAYAASRGFVINWDRGKEGGSFEKDNRFPQSFVLTWEIV